MKQLIILTTIILLTATTVTNSQPNNFFSMKEALSKNNNDIEFIFAAHGWLAIDIEIMGDFSSWGLTYRIIYEGEDMGKANTWLLLYRNKNNGNVYGYTFWKPVNKIMAHFYVPNFSDWYGFDSSTAISWDDSEIIDSDVFVTKLMQSSEYLNNKDSLSSFAGPEEIILGSSSGFLKEMYNFEKEGVYWLSSIYDSASQKRYNCYMPYSADGEISCEVIDLSSIATVDFHLIEVFPNPAKNNIHLVIPENVILSCSSFNPKLHISFIKF